VQAWEWDGIGAIKLINQLGLIVYMNMIETRVFYCYEVIFIKEKKTYSISLIKIVFDTGGYINQYLELAPKTPSYKIIITTVTCFRINSTFNILILTDMSYLLFSNVIG
jgi:hypothetical protein